MSNDNKAKAEQIQTDLDWELGIDLSSYSQKELQLLVRKVQDFLLLDVDTTELSPILDSVEDDDVSYDDDLGEEV